MEQAVLQCWDLAWVPCLLVRQVSVDRPDWVPECRSRWLTERKPLTLVTRWQLLRQLQMVPCQVAVGCSWGRSLHQGSMGKQQQQADCQVVLRQGWPVMEDSAHSAAALAAAPQRLELRLACC